MQRGPMGQEIERKFLVASDEWRRNVRASRRIVQGYLTRDPERAVRVRMAGDEAFVTIKGRTHGISRVEFEYPIPAADARHLLDELCLKPLVAKTRHEVEHAGMVWEVDEFESPRAGLTLAELELDEADQSYERPGWLGREVSGDPHYFNQNMT